jgi:hypothetical protein
MVEVPGIEPGSGKALQLAPHASSFIESHLSAEKRHSTKQASSIDREKELRTEVPHYPHVN